MFAVNYTYMRTIDLGERSVTVMASTADSIISIIESSQKTITIDGRLGAALGDAMASAIIFAGKGQTKPVSFGTVTITTDAEGHVISSLGVEIALFHDEMIAVSGHMAGLLIDITGGRMPDRASEGGG